MWFSHVNTGMAGVEMAAESQACECGLPSGVSWQHLKLSSSGNKTHFKRVCLARWQRVPQSHPCKISHLTISQQH